MLLEVCVLSTPLGCASDPRAESASFNEYSGSSRYVIDTKQVEETADDAGNWLLAPHTSTLIIDGCGGPQLANVDQWAKDSLRRPISEVWLSASYKLSCGQLQIKKRIQIHKQPETLSLELKTWGEWGLGSTEPSCAQPGIVQVKPKIEGRHFAQQYRWLQMVSQYAALTCGHAVRSPVPEPAGDANRISDEHLRRFINSQRYQQTFQERQAIMAVISAVGRNGGYYETYPRFKGNLMKSWETFRSKNPGILRPIFLKKMALNEFMNDAKLEYVSDSSDWVLALLRQIFGDGKIDFSRVIDISMPPPEDERIYSGPFLGPYFEDSIITLEEAITERSSGNSEGLTFVVADDAAYTGTDAIHVLENLYELTPDDWKFLISEYDIHFVVPYLALGVEDRVRNVAKRLGFSTHRLHFYPSPAARRIPRIRDILNETEIANFQKVYPASRYFGVTFDKADLLRTPDMKGQLNKTFFGFAHGYPNDASQFCVIDYGNGDRLCVPLFQAITGGQSMKPYKTTGPKSANGKTSGCRSERQGG